MQCVAADAPRHGCRFAGTATALPLGASMQHAAARPGHGSPQCSAAAPRTPRTLEVWLTQITWCTSASVYLSTCVPTAGKRTPLSIR